MNQTTKTPPQRFAERADVECRVNDLIKGLNGHYKEAENLKMIAHKQGNRMEAEIQASRQRAIFQALELLRKLLHPYLHKYNSGFKQCLHLGWKVEGELVICDECGCILENYTDRPKPQDL